MPGSIIEYNIKLSNHQAAQGYLQICRPVILSAKSPSVNIPGAPKRSCRRCLGYKQNHLLPGGKILRKAFLDANF